MSLLRIETPRLLLRPFSPTDAPAVVKLDADPDVIRFMRAPQYSEAEMAEVLSRYAARYENGFGMLAGVLKATGDLVGRYGVQRITVEGVDELEVTYSTRLEYRRKGYALEATEAVLEAAWRAGIPRLVGCIAPHNDPSAQLAERLGLRFERDVVYKETEMRMYAIGSPGSV